MTLEEMRARLKEIAEKCKAMLDAGELTAEQQTEFDALCEEHEKLTASIDRKERVEAMQADINAGTGRITVPNTPDAPRQAQADEQRGGAQARNHDTEAMGGFTDMAEFAQAVQRACVMGGSVDQRLAATYGDIQAAPSNFHQEQGSTQGYEVPPAMRRQIWELVMSEDLNLLGMVDGEPTLSNQVELPVDTETPWGGGVQARWRKEAGQMTPDKFTQDARDVKLHELYAFVTATDELLEDSPRLANRLTRKAAQAIRFKANDSIVNGTGAGQPLGYRKSGAVVAVAKETGQAADTIVTKNVSKAYSRMLAGSIGRAIWIANSDILPQLMELQIGNQPIWTPPNEGFKQAPGGILLGRPIMLSEHAETLGDAGDLQFVDPMGYYLAYKQSGIKYATSIHLFFDYGIQAFRWTFRFGGQPYLKAPITPNKGSNTKSHFVEIAARA